MPMELQGFDNLKDDLTNMASNLEFGAGVNRALQEGAKPIEEQMLHNASSDPQIITGALHDSPSERTACAVLAAAASTSPSA